MNNSVLVDSIVEVDHARVRHAYVGSQHGLWITNWSLSSDSIITFNLINYFRLGDVFEIEFLAAKFDFGHVIGRVRNDAIALLSSLVELVSIFINDKKTLSRLERFLRRDML